MAWRIDCFAGRGESEERDMLGLMLESRNERTTKL